MAVLSTSISAKVSQMSCQEYKGYKWQASQHSHPHNNTVVSRNKNLWDDQVSTPPPPPGRGKGRGWGRKRWGGG